MNPATFFDVLGDHALSCQVGGDRIALHNSLRDALAARATSAFGSANVTKEVGGELSEGRHRSGDIRIARWSATETA